MYIYTYIHIYVYIYRLLAQGVVIRVGKGGSNDPFLYTLVQSMLSEDGNIIASPNIIDPGLEVHFFFFPFFPPQQPRRPVVV